MKTNRQKAALIIALIDAHDFKSWHAVCSEFNAAGVNFTEQDRRFTEHYLHYVNGVAPVWDYTF